MTPRYRLRGETVCRGALEYDLAALVLRDLVEEQQTARSDALRSYGEHDADLLKQALPIYAAWVFASMLVAVPRRPELAAVVDARLRWLRGYVGR